MVKESKDNMTDSIGVVVYCIVLGVLMTFHVGLT